MHLFAAMIANYDAIGDPAYQSRVGRLFELFVANFFDPQRQILGEYFEEDWSKIEPAIVEPGHQAEWVWLLKGFERITGCPTGRYRSQLLASALRYRDPLTGCLVDEGDANGNIRKLTRRLWPQTEIAKAWIAQTETGESGAAEQAREALERLYRHYLKHPVLGGWYVSSVATAAPWSISFRPLHSITFCALSPKPTGFCASGNRLLIETWNVLGTRIKQLNESDYQSPRDGITSHLCRSHTQPNRSLVVQ
jgi:mannose/cellobiose epimerase-like protein (N-acyl-D-glucosamine 2-epimerase family)